MQKLIWLFMFFPTNISKILAKNRQSVQEKKLFIIFKELKASYVKKRA
jgi:hypothetical protein